MRYVYLTVITQIKHCLQENIPILHSTSFDISTVNERND